MGKVHKYLVLTLDFQNPGEIWITMIDYLKVVVQDLPKVIIGRSTRPAVNHMFQVSHEENQTLLDKQRATAFHHTVAQLIFFMSRSRKYIKMAIDFPCTRVRRPDEYYWGKLVRGIRYIRSTLHLPLLLRAYSLNVIKCWVDASFGAHPDYKGHNILMISME